MSENESGMNDCWESGTNEGWESGTNEGWESGICDNLCENEAGID